MKINIGQVFRVTGATRALTSETIDHLVDYKELTAGRRGPRADINKGIWAYKAIRETIGSHERRPAVLLLSNPYKAESEDTPWLDIIDADSG